MHQDYSTDNHSSEEGPLFLHGTQLIHSANDNTTNILMLIEDNEKLKNSMNIKKSVDNSTRSNYIHVDLRYEYESRRNRNQPHDDIELSINTRKTEAPTRASTSHDKRRKVTSPPRKMKEEYDESFSMMDQCALEVGRLVLKTVIKKPELSVADSMNRFFFDSWLEKFNSNLDDASKFSIELLAELQRSITDLTTKFGLDDSDGSEPNKRMTYMSESMISKTLCGLGMEAYDQLLSEIDKTNPVLHEIKRTLLPAIFSEFPFSEAFDGGELIHIERLFNDAEGSYRDIPGLGIGNIDGNLRFVESGLKRKQFRGGLDSMLVIDEGIAANNDEMNIKRGRALTGQKYIRYRTWHESFVEMKERYKQQETKLSKFFLERDSLYARIGNLEASVIEYQSNLDELRFEHEELIQSNEELTSKHHDTSSTLHQLQIQHQDDMNHYQQVQMDLNETKLLLEGSIKDNGTEFIRILRQKYDDLQRDYDSLKISCDTIQEKNLDMQEQAEVAAKYLASMEQMQDECKDKLVKLSMKMANKFGSINRHHVADDEVLALASTALSSIVGPLSSPSSKNKKKLSLTASDHQSYEQLIDYLSQWNDSLSKSVLSYQVLVSELNISLSSLQEQSFSQDTEYQVKHDQLQEQFVMEMKATNAESAKQFKSYEKKLQRSKHHIDSLQCEMRAIEEENECLKYAGQTQCQHQETMIASRTLELQSTAKNLSEGLIRVQEQRDMLSCDMLYHEKYSSSQVETNKLKQDIRKIKEQMRTQDTVGITAVKNMKFMCQRINTIIKLVPSSSLDTNIISDDDMRISSPYQHSTVSSPLHLPLPNHTRHSRPTSRQSTARPSSSHQHISSTAAIYDINDNIVQSTKAMIDDQLDHVSSIIIDLYDFKTNYELQHHHNHMMMLSLRQDHECVSMGVEDKDISHHDADMQMLRQECVKLQLLNNQLCSDNGMMQLRLTQMMHDMDDMKNKMPNTGRSNKTPSRILHIVDGIEQIIDDDAHDEVALPMHDSDHYAVDDMIKDNDVEYDDDCTSEATADLLDLEQALSDDLSDAIKVDNLTSKFDRLTTKYLRLKDKHCEASSLILSLQEQLASASTHHDDNNVISSLSPVATATAMEVAIIKGKEMNMMINEFRKDINYTHLLPIDGASHDLTHLLIDAPAGHVVHNIISSPTHLHPDAVGNDSDVNIHENHDDDHDDVDEDVTTFDLISPAHDDNATNSIISYSQFDASLPSVSYIISSQPQATLSSSSSLSSVSVALKKSRSFCAQVRPAASKKSVKILQSGLKIDTTLTTPLLSSSSIDNDDHQNQTSSSVMMNPAFLEIVRKNEKEYAKEIGYYAVILTEAKQLFNSLNEEISQIRSYAPDGKHDDRDHVMISDMLHDLQAKLHDGMGWIFDAKKLEENFHIINNKNNNDALSSSSLPSSTKSSQAPMPAASQMRMMQSYNMAKIMILSTSTAANTPTNLPIKSSKANDEVIISSSSLSAAVDMEVLNTIEQVSDDLLQRAQFHGGWKTLLYHSDGTLNTDFDLSIWPLSLQVDILHDMIQHERHDKEEMKKYFVDICSKYQQRLKLSRTKSEAMHHTLAEIKHSNSLMMQQHHDVDIANIVPVTDSTYGLSSPPIQPVAQHSDDNNNNDDHVIDVKNRYFITDSQYAKYKRSSSHDNDKPSSCKSEEEKALIQAQLQDQLHQRDLAIYRRVKQQIVDDSFPIPHHEFVMKEDDYRSLKKALHHSIHFIQQLTCFPISSLSSSSATIASTTATFSDVHHDVYDDYLLKSFHLVKPNIPTVIDPHKHHLDIQVKQQPASFLPKLMSSPLDLTPNTHHHVSTPELEYVNISSTSSMPSSSSSKLTSSACKLEPLLWPQRQGNKATMSNYRLIQNMNRHDKALKHVHDKHDQHVDDHMNTDSMLQINIAQSPLRPLSRRASMNQPHSKTRSTSPTKHDHKSSATDDVPTNSPSPAQTLAYEMKQLAEQLATGCDNMAARILFTSSHDSISRTLPTITSSNQPTSSPHHHKHTNDFPPDLLADLQDDAVNDDVDVATKTTAVDGNKATISASPHKNRIDGVYQELFCGRKIPLYPAVFEDIYRSSDVARYAKLLNERVNYHINAARRLEKAIQHLAENYNNGAIIDHHLPASSSSAVDMMMSISMPMPRPSTAGPITNQSSSSTHHVGMKASIPIARGNNNNQMSPHAHDLIPSSSMLLEDSLSMSSTSTAVRTSTAAGIRKPEHHHSKLTNLFAFESNYNNKTSSSFEHHYDTRKMISSDEDTRVISRHQSANRKNRTGFDISHRFRHEPAATALVPGTDDRRRNDISNHDHAHDMMVAMGEEPSPLVLMSLLRPNTSTGRTPLSPASSLRYQLPPVRASNSKS